MNPDKSQYEGGGEREAVRDFFIIAKTKNAWYLEAISLMSDLHEMAINYTEKDKQNINVLLPQARRSVRRIFDLTSTTLRLKQKVNAVVEFERILGRKMDESGLMEFHKKWKDYCLLIEENHLIPSNVETMNAKDSFYV